ncbi:MAG: Gfo/Idh/MocA family oxidoreductase [Oscillospiraceae bacterium]|nr:Gfo/Idh/MocA family oxidoreductase [Oscillospiraceae bacterium]
MSGKIKAAVVGCGGISNWHFGRVKNFSEVEYTGFYDIVKERAENMAAQKPGSKAYDCYIEMYDDLCKAADASGDKKVLYVCVPPDQHGDIEIEAIKRGIHMMIDKPIATEVGVTEKICNLATQYNIIISVGFQDRYLDLVDPIRDMLKDRDIGLINGSWVGGIPGLYWWRRRSTSGGQVVEQNIHLYDMIRYFIGEPVSLYTASGKGIVKPFQANLPGYDVEDYSATTVTFRNGSVANLFTGCYMQEGGGMKNGLTFYAKDATIDYQLRNKVVFTDKNGTKEIKTELDQGLALDRVFIDAVLSGKPEDIQKIRSPYEDAIKSLKFTIATNTSIDTGKAVYLNL